MTKNPMDDLRSTKELTEEKKKKLFSVCARDLVLREIMKVTFQAEIEKIKKFKNHKPKMLLITYHS